MSSSTSSPSPTRLHDLFSKIDFTDFSGSGGGGGALFTSASEPFSGNRIPCFTAQGFVIEHCNLHSFLIQHFSTWNCTFRPASRAGLFYFVSVSDYCVLCSWQARILSNTLSEEAYHYHYYYHHHHHHHHHYHNHHHHHHHHNHHHPLSSSSLHEVSWRIWLVILSPSTKWDLEC